MHPRQFLTSRQKNEIEYHRKHAELHKDILKKPFSYEVVTSKKRRWEGAYWEMYTFLLDQQVKGKNILIAGCGFGEDVLRLAKMGAKVYAFDLSPESLEIAEKLASRENALNIDFREMPIESMDYEANFFDYILARDIFHHVQIKEAMEEIVRVSKNEAVFVLNEVYSHSILDKIRHCIFIEKKIYPLLQSFIYEGDIYITKDESKLNQFDINFITRFLEKILIKKYFNFFVGRFIPDRYNILNKLDRVLLLSMGPVAQLTSGRILIAGTIRK